MKKYWIPLLLLLFIAADIFLGSVKLPFHQIWSSVWGGEAPDYVNKIVWNFRFPKMITALLSGMALAVCGVNTYGTAALIDSRAIRVSVFSSRRAVIGWVSVGC